MKRIVFLLLLALALAAVTTQSNIVNNSGTTAADSLNLKFIVSDSVGRHLLNMASPDSIFLTVEYPSGAISFKDTLLYNDASIGRDSSSGEWHFWIKTQISNIDGIGQDGVYSWTILVKDASLSLPTPSWGQFQVYQAANFETWASGRPDSAMMSRIMGRKMWGIAAGSGDDSTGYASRVVAPVVSQDTTATGRRLPDSTAIYAAAYKALLQVLIDTTITQGALDSMLDTVCTGGGTAEIDLDAIDSLIRLAVHDSSGALAEIFWRAAANYYDTIPGSMGYMNGGTQWLDPATDAITVTDTTQSGLTFAAIMGAVLHDSTGTFARAVWGALLTAYNDAGTFGQMNNGTQWPDSSQFVATQQNALTKVGLNDDSTVVFKQVTISGANGAGGSLSVWNSSGPGASFEGSVNAGGYRNPGLQVNKMKVYNAYNDDVAFEVQATGDNSIGMRVTGVGQDWLTQFLANNFAAEFYDSTGGGGTGGTCDIDSPLVVGAVVDALRKVGFNETDSTLTLYAMDIIDSLNVRRKMMIGVTTNAGTTGALQIANATGPAAYFRSDYAGTEGAAIWARGRAGAHAVYLSTDVVGGVSGPTLFITASDTADAVYVANLRGDSLGGNAWLMVAEGGGRALELVAGSAIYDSTEWLAYPNYALEIKGATYIHGRDNRDEGALIAIGKGKATTVTMQSTTGKVLWYSKNDGTPSALDTAVFITGGSIISQYNMINQGDTVATLEDLSAAHGSGNWNAEDLSALDAKVDLVQAEVDNINGWNPATDSVNVDGSAFALLDWAKNMYAFLGWGEIGGGRIFSKEKRNADADSLFVGYAINDTTYDTIAVQVIYHVSGAAGDAPNDTTTSTLWD